MNPFLRSKYALLQYLLVMAGIALTYAFVLGLAFRLPFTGIWINALTYGLVFALEGLLIWSIMRYVVPDNKRMYTFVLITIGILIVATLHGLESLILYFFCLKFSFASYLQSIGIRVFISVLIYVLFLLYYKRFIEEKEELHLEDVNESGKSAPVEPIERISVRSGQKIKIIALSDILYLQAEGDYVAIITNDGRWLKEQTMKYFEENLPVNQFIRIHRSYIVQIHAITRIERNEQHYQVALNNKERIKISTTGYRILKEKLGL